MTRACMLLTLLFISGCSYLTGIPSTWPEHWPTLTNPQADRCPDISGSYNDRGKSAAPGLEDSLLRWFVKIQYPSNLSKSDVVELTLNNNDILHVLIKGGGKVLKEATLSRAAGDFVCNEDGLSPNPTSGFVSGEGGAGYQKHVISFTTAEGGVLAGKVRNTAMGFAWMIPVVGTQTMWYRWDPATSVGKIEK